MSRRQLLAASVTDDEIKHRLAAGRLIRVHQGVYAVGHRAISAHARIRAGLLAAGATAAASRNSATFLFSLIPTLLIPVEVTITTGQRRPRPGLVIHRATSVETTRRHGLPVTTPRQTLADLGWPDKLVREALARRLIRHDDVPATHEVAPTESELEEAMGRLCTAAGLPQPLFQHRVGPYRVDFAWLAERVLVETDGYATHGRRQAFEDDRARDAHLTARGYTVIRFTWRQLTETPFLVAARLAAALALRATA